MDVQLGGFGGAVGDGGESFEDLACEDGAGDGAHGRGFVVGEVPFVGGGEVVERGDGGGSEEGGG